MVQRAGGEGAVTLRRAQDGATGDQQQDHGDPAQSVAIGGPGYGRQQQIYQGPLPGIAGKVFTEQDQKCHRERQERQRDFDGGSLAPGWLGSGGPTEQQGRQRDDAGGIAHPPGREDDRLRGPWRNAAEDQAGGADTGTDRARQQGDQHELGDCQWCGQQFSGLHPTPQEITTQHRLEGVSDGDGRRDDDRSVARGGLICGELGIVGGKGPYGDPRQHAIAEQQQGTEGDARGWPDWRCIGIGKGKQEPEPGCGVIDGGQGQDGEQPLQASCRVQRAMPHGERPFLSVLRSLPRVYRGAVAAVGFRLVERLVGRCDELLHRALHGRHQRGDADADGHYWRGSRILMVDP
ncbi:hypothetical protein D3C85_684070 [compost metagenome]